MSIAIDEDIIAGPYELNHKENSKDKVTFCIMNNNEISKRIYEGLNLIKQENQHSKSFDDALMVLEDMIKSYKDNKYIEKSE